MTHFDIWIIYVTLSLQKLNFTAQGLSPCYFERCIIRNWKFYNIIHPLEFWYIVNSPSWAMLFKKYCIYHKLFPNCMFNISNSTTRSFVIHKTLTSNTEQLRVHSIPEILVRVKDMRVLSHFSRVWLCATLWTVAHQTPLFMGILQAILEWVAMSFSRGSSQPRDWTYVSYISCTGRRVLYHWATREAKESWS